MPGIRRAYEERITAAYFEGHEDARTGRRPRRTGRPGDERGERGGEVIPLPYLQLLRPPSEVTRVEEKGERERSVADEKEQSPVPEPELEPGPGPAADILLSARDVRETRSAVERRPVVRRNGRPSVPPLKRAADTGALRDKNRRQQEQSDPQVPRDEDRPRLSDKARVLADELEGKGRTSGRGRDENDEQTPPR